MDKFLAKMTNEDNKYKDQLRELEGAMNPDAEAVLLQVGRYVSDFTGSDCVLYK